MKTCFISKNIYPVAANNGARFAGGAELQLLTLAKKFKDLGHKAVFVTDDFGQADIEEMEDIKYVKVPFRYMGNSRLYLLSDWFSLYCKLKEIDADVYILKGPRFTLFIAGLYAICSKKRVVFISTIDTDSDPHIMRSIDPLYSRLLYYLGLKMVPLVVCQSKHQQKNFYRYFKKEASVIQNIYSIANVSNGVKKQTALWVGTNNQAKAPGFFLNLARKSPEISYKMAMVPSQDTAFQKQLETEIRGVHNIDYLGFVPEREMGKLYAEASLLVNVSELEGFPNVFLHAWAHKTPVISLKINPDGIIKRYRMGFCSGSMEQMIKDIRLLLQNDQLRQEMGNNGYVYVKRHHDADMIAEQYISLFEGRV
jgi:glycosyltransferase involved in cell wall biosynthesis